MFSLLSSLPADAPFFIGLLLFNTLILFFCHFFRNHLTLGPLFATAGAMTLLFWQMRHLGWWLQWNALVIDTATIAFIPPLLMGLVFCYAFDGIRAARSYVSVLIFTSLLGWGFSELRDALAHYVPIPYVFYLSSHTHFSTLFALFLGASACLLSYELLRRAGRLIAFLIAPAFAVFCYLLSFSLLEYGWNSGVQHAIDMLPSAMAFTLIPVAFSGFYCIYAILCRLYVPVRSVSNILFFWRSTSSPQSDNPNHQGFLNSGKIISDLQQLNNQLEEAQRLQKYHIELSPLAIVMTDAHGTIVSANPAAEKLYHQSQKQLFRSSIVSFFNDCSLEQLLSNPDLRIVPFSAPDGQDYWHEYTIIPLYDGFHQLVGYQFIVKDITLSQKREFKQKIEDKIRNIHQTGKMLSHDISNLFLGIQGGVAQIKTAFKKHDKTLLEQSCQQIYSALSQGRNMLRHLNSKHSFSSPTFCSCHLAPIMKKAIDIVKARATEMQVSVQVTTTANPVVHVDASQITRVLTNLLINAIRASSPGDIIYVSCSSSENGVTICITDQGVGMTEAQLLHAFDPGFSTKGNGQGGLGLAISYLIIEAHGGLLKLEHNPSGSGIIAEIWLPCEKEFSTSDFLNKTILVALPENSPLLQPLANKLDTVNCQWSESQGVEEFLAIVDESWDILLIHPEIHHATDMCMYADIPIVGIIKDDLSISPIKGSDSLVL